jgi:predicted nucleic acid-binding protein
VELSDVLVAAAALMNRALLWTRNRKHCPMKGLSFF